MGHVNKSLYYIMKGSAEEELTQQVADNGNNNSNVMQIENDNDISETGRAILEKLKTIPPHESGISVETIVAAVPELEPQEVKRELTILVDGGYICEGIDDSH